MPTTQLGRSEPIRDLRPASELSGKVIPLCESAALPAEEMLPAVYEELRRLAASYLRGERSEHTLQKTALVHEAYLRLRSQPEIEWKIRRTSSASLRGSCGRR
ncbi:MAG: ECF-type sigma factor [Chthoniobacterales bacterium]